MIILIRKTSNFSGYSKNQFKYKIQHSRTDSLGRTYPIDTNTAIYRLRDFFKPHIGILEYVVPDRKNILAYKWIRIETPIIFFFILFPCQIIQYIFALVPF